MVEASERMTRSWRNQRAAEIQALRDVVLFAVVFGGVVLVNAVLGLVLIEVFGSLEAQPTAPSEGAAALSRRFRRRGPRTADQRRSR